MATMKPNPTGNYIKEVTLPSGNVYEIVDEAARDEINTLATNITSVSSTVNSISTNLTSVSARVDSLSSTVNNMSKYTAFLGVVSHSAAWTKIEDGSTTSTILVGSTTTTVATGNIVIYKPSNSTSAAQEYIWNGSAWSFFGDISALNLGTLAYKSSATYTKIKSVDSTSKTVTSSTSYTPAGTISFTSATAYVSITSTVTAPANTTDYWVYLPAGTVSVTYVMPSTSADVVKNVTANTVVTNLSITAATSATVSGGLDYTNVSNHNLRLNYFVVGTGASVTSSTTKAYVKVSNAKTTTCNFDGTTIYVNKLAVDTKVPSTASFTANSTTITVNSSEKFVTTVTHTTETANVSFA